MTFASFALVVASQVFVVAGQVMLKRGLNLTHQHPIPRGAVAARIGGGVAFLTLWFLIWMGLLRKLDLSLIYPFEGLSPVLLVLAARVFLQETLTWKTWAGVALIALGTVLVGLS
jgi:undecaprenyl phosphate-alpha-L-ara4N flippase subunit ArnE